MSRAAYHLFRSLVVFFAYQFAAFSALLVSDEWADRWVRRKLG